MQPIFIQRFHQRLVVFHTLFTLGQAREVTLGANTGEREANRLGRASDQSEQKHKRGDVARGKVLASPLKAGQSFFSPTGGGGSAPAASAAQGV